MAQKQRSQTSRYRGEQGHVNIWSAILDAHFEGQKQSAKPAYNNLSGFSDIRIAIKNVLPALDHCSDFSSPLELKLMKQVEITAVAMHLQSHVCMSFTNWAINGLVAPHSRPALLYSAEYKIPAQSKFDLEINAVGRGGQLNLSTIQDKV